MPTLFHHVLFKSARHTSSCPALVHKKNTISYQQLETLVKEQAQALLGIHLKPQQRVAIYLPKQLETVTNFFAVTLAGGVLVPINPVLKAAQVAYILNDCQVQILITSQARLQSLGPFLEDCPFLRTIVLVDKEVPKLTTELAQPVLAWQEFLKHATQYTIMPETIDTDMAAILYTSGSTGKPKGVVLSHRNIVAATKSTSEYLNITEADRLLAVLPFSFDVGLNQLTTALLQGACCVLLDYLLPRDVLTALETYQITGLAAVPPIWVQLSSLEWTESINAHLRYCTSSGGKMPKSVLASIRQKSPNSLFYLHYGLTEAFRTSYLPPDQIDLKPDSVGKAIPNAAFLVVREDGSLCAPHEPGELVHRGPFVAMGYWNDPVKTAERFKPAPGQAKELPLTEIAVWSGDTVTVDEEGYLYFIGRKDDMIKTSGYRVSPTEVEEVVYASGLVTEAAAIGVEHDALGQAILLVVSLEHTHDFDERALLDFCRTQLPSFMIPAKIEILHSLPKNPNGKIDRNTLAHQFTAIFQSTS